MIQSGERCIRVALFGLALALAGAVLDFYSSYQIMSGTTMTDASTGNGMMSAVQYSSAAPAWGVGLAVLGILLVVTGLTSASSIGAGRMSVFGGLMAVYGIIMLLVGAAMDSGVSPAMQSASLSGLGMLVVGTLMVINGLLMFRSGGMAPPTRAR